MRFLRLFPAIALALSATVWLSACTLTDSPVAAIATPIVSGAPVVRLASPLPNEAYRAGASVIILGRIENAGADIAMVDILLDNQSIGSATNPNPSGAIAFTITNSWLSGTAGAYTLALRAVRSDGTVGETSVTIDVEGDAAAVTATTSSPALPTPVVPAQTQPTLAPTVATVATLALTSASSDLPTQEPSAAPTNTTAPISTAPMVTVISGANVRSGPGVVFDPPIATLAAGAIANIIAISPDRLWYRITYNNGNGSGWISASVVETSGELSGLPQDAGPAKPAPTAVPPTAIAATAGPTSVPAGGSDLSITLLTINPDPLVCNQQGTVQLTVVNTGAASAATTVLVQDIYNNTPGASVSLPVPALATNQSADLTTPLTISTNFAEAHIIRGTVDNTNQVGETNETNNTRDKPYTLATGGC